MDPNVPVEPGKIFVGGISWDTHEEGLKQYFEKFGEVSDCVIMRDPMQNKEIRKHRGFGFVTFKDPQVIQQILQVTHMLDNKKIDPKPAQIKSATNPNAGPSGPVKKIFIGGVAHGTSEEDIRQYFSRFGTVTDVDLKFDKATQRMRGFGFVGFESEDVVEQMVQTHYHQINGKTVEVKKAEPRYATVSGRAYSMQAAMSAAVNPGSAYSGYPQSYNQDYRGANGQQYSQPYSYGSNGPAYGYGYGQGSNYNFQGGYGQYGSAPTNYGYDRSGYPQSQTSSTERADTSSSYYGYGHNAQVASYPQGDSTYAPARSSYGGGPEGFQQSGGYSDYNRGGTTQQRGYGAGPPYVR